MAAKTFLEALKSVPNGLGHGLAWLRGPPARLASLVQPQAPAWTNQDVINAFYRVARDMGQDGWSMLRRAGLTGLARDRAAAYQGPPIDTLPGLTQEEKTAILAALGPLRPPAAPAPPIHWVGPTVNYTGGRAGHGVDLIVVHYTANGSGASTITWFKNPAAQVSAHYVLDRDGQIYQVVRDQDTAWHAGVGLRPGLGAEQNAARMQRNSQVLANPRGIGIEVVDWGPLTRVGDHYETWTRRPFFGRVVQGSGSYWEPDDAAQYRSLAALVGWLCRAHNLPVQFPPNGPAVYEPDAAVLARFRGILGHQAIDDTKQDPGPAFSWDRLRAGLK